MRHLKDLPVLVLGLGASGLAMARWCARHGARVTVADTREAPALLGRLQAEWPDVAFVGGPLSAALIEGTSVRAVYCSPGLTPATLAPVVDAARAVGLPVGGELDLFARALSDLRTVELPPVVAEPEAEPDAQMQIEMAPQTIEEPAAAEAVPEAPAPAEAPEAVVPPSESASVEAVLPTEAIEAEAVEPEPAATPSAMAESAPRDPSTHVAVAQPEEAEPADAAATEAQAVPAAAVAPAAALRQPTAGQPYVPSAAKEAAEFVARIAELAVSNPASAAVEEAAPVAEAPPVVEVAVPKGYEPAVLAITGTNGKTTVTALTGQLVERAGKTVAVAGNIGPTLLDTLSAHLDADTLPEVWVLELSSFQLDGVQGFEPTAATVLNLTQDHLDWHGDMAAYAGAKQRIFGARGLMILNRDDAGVMAMLPPPVRVKLQRPQIRTHITFGAGLPLRPSDFGIERVNGMTWLVRALEADETIKRKRGAAAQEEDIILQRLMPADALRIRGQHNALNALAALALASAAGCPLGPMLYGLREYQGEPHRVESVAILDQVEYFDDSKGTNVGATVAALGGLGAERRVVAILGGDGKGQDFTPLAAPVRQFARAVVLIGRDAPVIEAALADTGVTIVHAESMEQAVQLAARRAHPGDAVLLSPACASFDMFRDYGHRAAVFCEAVQALPESSYDGIDEGHSA
ncbi:UDP-N-acetylmuramoyl-L-alanine--D-glutamate ligase [Variovorax sp. UMC13]|uniref:UDP-N-acetylmuramoyl-L-alanine--D-glutamate ligase n=1 Tax=Variovorax sp. UMC13 TaxID=1862326 RepID=UPI0016033F72|nr:UDP-N-acetylmuramoyl-L-alanine--D-glutamate ligase [Variovorax sp. UMC13]MBB1600295.1 UDP-N-acetylmuramoylalanine--D-glutamate ligase [Variovorax sp. UMC13]